MSLAAPSKALVHILCGRRAYDGDSDLVHRLETAICQSLSIQTIS